MTKIHFFAERFLISCRRRRSFRFQARFYIVLFVVGLGGMQTGRSLETWDREFTGSGNPDLVLTESSGINSSTYGFDSRFTPFVGTVPGWLTVHGNPGGLLKKDFSGNTRAGGWTAEWAFKAHPTAPLPMTDVIQFSDDSNLINVRYQDGQVQLLGVGGSSSGPFGLDIRQPHTYRLLRQPGREAVELYIDNSVAPAISLIPDPCGPPICDEGNLNHLFAAPSHFESAFDFIRYKSGASLPPPPPPPTAPGIYIPSEIQYGANQQPYTVYPAVNNYAALSGKPLPDLWQSGDTIQIMAARGEYEPATFVVATDTLLQAVNVQVGPLTGAAGTLPAQTLDVRVVQPYFRRVTDWPAEMPWLLVHDPNLFTIENRPPPWATDLPSDAPKSQFAYTKTNLLTRPAIDTETLQSSDIAERQQFWITARIPGDAQPGTYSAPVTVVPANAPAMELTLNVRVPDMELQAPNFEYSAYYPAFLESEPWLRPDHTYAQLSDTQYVNEMRNMLAHGLTNPVFYSGVDIKPDGSLDFTQLEEFISLRERAGMNLQGKSLYLPDNPLRIVQRDLTPAEYVRNVELTSQIVAWANQKGYGDVYFMANDEASASGLLAERDSFQSIHDGGGKVFVAVRNSDYFASAGDLLDVPVFPHPGALMADQGAAEVTAEEFLLNPEDMKSYGDPEWLMTPDLQAMIEAVHQNDYDIFTYMDPVAGEALPEVHRRFRGLGLWKVGLDGTMTWAYTHIQGNDVSFAEFDPDQDTLPSMKTSFVFRGEEAPFDTLAWEGFREGVDDARYLATLQEAMSAAITRGQHTVLVSETQQWLDSLDVDADLDAMRLEMARRIEILAPLATLATCDVNCMSPGILSISGNYTQKANGTLEIDIMGTNPGEGGHDQLHVTGTALLNGTLNLQTDSDFTPGVGAMPGMIGNQFVILAASNVTGRFAIVNGNHLGKGRFYLPMYNTTNVTLGAFQAEAGDVDGDKDVDITDFNRLAANFDPAGDNSAANDWMTADFDSDGDVDITDFNSLASNFAPIGYGVNDSIPEPSSLFLFILGWVGAMGILFRRKEAGA